MSATAPAPSAAPNRRERNKRRTRDLIYGAALDLFAEKGFEQTTIEEITERADVARGTFFTHFQNKDALVSAWSEHRQAELERKLRAYQGAGVADALEHCVTVLVEVDATGGDERLEAVMLRSWVKAGLPITEAPYTARILADVIRAGVGEGAIAPDVDADRIGNLLRDAYLGALFRRVREDRADPDLAGELRWTINTLMRGIARREGG